MKKMSILSISAILAAVVCGGESFAASSLSKSSNAGPVSTRAPSLHFGGSTRSASLGPQKQKMVKSLSAQKSDDLGATESRSASVSRNSAGRFIGGNKEQSVSMAALPNPLFDRLDTIEDNVQNLADTKQDKLLDSTYITVVDSTHVDVNMEALTPDIQTIVDSAIEGKVDKDQTTENANKILVTDDTGVVNPDAYINTADLITTTTLTDAVNTALADYATTTAMETELDGKVDEDQGDGAPNKFLTTNDSGIVQATMDISDVATTTALNTVSDNVTTAQTTANNAAETANNALTTANATNAALANYATTTAMNTALNDKVDKEQGDEAVNKVLTTNASGTVQATMNISDFATTSALNTVSDNVTTAQTTANNALTTANATNAALVNFATTTDMNTALNGKVDKIQEGASLKFLTTDSSGTVQATMNISDIQKVNVSSAGFNTGKILYVNEDGNIAISDRTICDIGSSLPICW